MTKAAISQSLVHGLQGSGLGETAKLPVGQEIGTQLFLVPGLVLLFQLQGVFLF